MVLGKLVLLGQFCLVVLDKLLLDVVGHQFVAREGGREGSTSAGERAQCDAVACQFLERNLSGEFLVGTLAVHTHDDGAASLQVAHHITHVVAGHEHLKVVDRLQHLRSSLAESL